MGVNPTDNVRIFPIAKISIRVGSAPRSTDLQLKNDNELSQSSKETLSRPLTHPVRFEKGSLLDIYA
jgi:hypothetical protein